MFDPNKFWKKQILEWSVDEIKKQQDYKPKYQKGDILTTKCAKRDLVTDEKIHCDWTVIHGVITDVDGIKYYIAIERTAYGYGVDLDDYSVETEEIGLEDCYDFDKEKYIPYPNTKTEARLSK